MKKILALVAAIALTGCSALTSNLANLQGAQNPAQALAGIAKFTKTDLQAANARAIAGGDLAGQACYPVLISVLDQAQAQVAGAAGAGAAGPIDLFEASRIIAKQGPGQANTIAQQVNVGCAALFVDTQATLVQLGLIAGAVAPKLP